MLRYMRAHNPARSRYTQPLPLAPSRPHNRQPGNPATRRKQAPLDWWLTSCNTQVSDELVLEQQQAEDRGEATAEHGPKNIKRRVYDV